MDSEAIELDTPAGNIADSLSRIFALTPRPEVRQKAYSILGVKSNQQFAVSLQKRINAYLARSSQRRGKRSCLEIRKERDLVQSFLQKLAPGLSGLTCGETVGLMPHSLSSTDLQPSFGTEPWAFSTSSDSSNFSDEETKQSTVSNNSTKKHFKRRKDYDLFYPGKSAKTVTCGLMDRRLNWSTDSFSGTEVNGNEQKAPNWRTFRKAPGCESFMKTQENHTKFFDSDSFSNCSANSFLPHATNDFPDGCFADDEFSSDENESSQWNSKPSNVANFSSSPLDYSMGSPFDSESSQLSNEASSKIKANFTEIYRTTFEDSEAMEIGDSDAWS